MIFSQWFCDGPVSECREGARRGIFYTLCRLAAGGLTEMSQMRGPGVLTARLSGYQVVINGHALFPPLSVVATIPADPEPRSGWSARSEARTNDLDRRRSLILPAGSHQELPGDGHHGHGM